MHIYLNDPDGWEPRPWDAPPPLADQQRQGFLLRAAKPIIWSRIDFAAFPAEGIFGQDRDWFLTHDIEFVATFDAEQLVLVRNAYAGFPDPPEWGLASRPEAMRLETGQAHPWTPWGFFETLPKSWHVPGES